MQEYINNKERNSHFGVSVIAAGSERQWWGGGGGNYRFGPFVAVIWAGWVTTHIEVMG